jgi:GTP-binding protein
MNNSLPVVALVGAPNVGKSTLLNKIAGEHLAVTSPVPGTTRDRQYAEIHWNEKDFLLLDTAGLDLASKSDLESSIQEQIQIAIKEASVIVLVADYKVGSQALDRKVLLALRKNNPCPNNTIAPLSFITLSYCSHSLSKGIIISCLF